MNKEVKVGSPPRMRGKVIGGFGVLVQIGITPACAGKSALCVNGGARSRDHPRMCGEKTAREFITYLIQGSPPRMRGRAASRLRPGAAERITPAYAGKRTLRRCTTGFLRDHPRVCGEEFRAYAKIWNEWGSPPRMRGRVYAERHKDHYTGITPAYAGKRSLPPSALCGTRDHPRVCGEESGLFWRQTGYAGSPPRMRGRVKSYDNAVLLSGITPAYAGKRGRPEYCNGGNQDHPRVCGEEASVLLKFIAAAGSPPRMRGRVGAPGCTTRP